MTDETALPAESPPVVAPPTPETPVPDGPEGTETDSTPEPETTASGEKLTRVQRNWRALEQDRDYWREIAMRSSQPREEPKPEPKVESDKPKTLADFDYDEGKYQAHLFQQAEERAVKAAERKLKEQEERSTATRRQSEFEAREKSFSKDLPDYLEVTRNPRLPITQDIAAVVAESEEGPALAYYLGKNIEIAERIAQLPPMAAARELGRIEAKLQHEREKAKEKPAVSKAPPPPPKIEGAEPGIEKDPDQMPVDEWLKWREKQIARKRKS